MENLESKVLQSICNCEVSIMDRGYPVSSTFIRESLGITPYQARKALKSLKDKGLIKPYRNSFWDDYSEQYFLAGGYRLTEEAKKTDEYRAAEQREIQICQEVFNIDVLSAFKEGQNGQE